MRTIIEAARTMIHSANMLKPFWAEAVNTAVFILNRTGSNPGNTTSPFEIWHKKKVDMSIFKIFGLKVAAHIPKERRLKLDVKSKEGILVGYSEKVKGYRIYFYQSKKVEILKDIIFLQGENKTTKKTGIVYMRVKKIKKETVKMLTMNQEERLRKMKLKMN